MFTIYGAKSEYVDDFADTHEIGVLARGDVYDGERGVALYVARWFPERRTDIELLVVLLPTTESASRCSLAFRYSKNESLGLVDPSSIWIDWTPHALPISVHDGTTTYCESYDLALEVARLALSDHATIRDYVAEISA